MSFYISEETRMITEMKRFLPEIEGVKWNIEIMQLCPITAKREYGVSLRADFKVDVNGLREVANDIEMKLHEITSGGQIKLELE